MRRVEGTEPQQESGPNGVVRAGDPVPDRPNIEWWTRHGGREWLEEVQRRRSAQDRYSKQEAWLAGHFADAPALRVLDFGCGYGRHLRHLKQQRHLDLFGCDVSPSMVAVVGEHVGDVAWAGEHVKLIEPVGRLPFDDWYFDVTYTSEVLIHVNPEDLSKVLRELIRVTFERLILIENKRTDQTAFDSAAHAGCWLHDLVGELAKLGFTNVRVLEDVLDDQDVYLVDLEAGAADPLGKRLRSALAARDVEIQRLRHEAERSKSAILTAKDRVARLDQMVSDALVRRVTAENARRVSEERAERTSEQLFRLERSLAVRAVQKAKRFKRTYGLLRRVVESVQSLPEASSSTSKIEADLSSIPAVAPDRPVLPFAGIAAAGFPATPESFVAAAPPVVGVCHPHWRGIRASTFALCDGVLQIEEIRDDAHAHAIAKFLQEASTRTLVIQGIPPRSQYLAMVLREVLPELRILNVFHSSTAPSTFAKESVLLDEMIDLAKAGVLDGIGFMKPGMAECLRRLGIHAYPLYNRSKLGEKPRETKPFAQGPMNIGVFVPNLVHKNLSTQVMAALSIPESIVNLTELPDLGLDRYMDRIRVHGLLPHANFLERLGEMDVNLYVSLSECFPMTVVESLERGVVCLTSNATAIFDDDEFLRKALVVPHLDDPSAIASQAERAVSNRVEIVARAHAHLQRVNEKADELWDRFVHG